MDGNIAVDSAQEILYFLCGDMKSPPITHNMCDQINGIPA